MFFFNQNLAQTRMFLWLKKQNKKLINGSIRKKIMLKSLFLPENLSLLSGYWSGFMSVNFDKVLINGDHSLIDCGQ